MILVFSVLFVLSVVFCLAMVVYTIAFVLMRRELENKPITKFTTNRYYDYPFFKKNDSIFSSQWQQFLHR